MGAGWLRAGCRIFRRFVTQQLKKKKICNHSLLHFLALLLAPQCKSFAWFSASRFLLGTCGGDRSSPNRCEGVAPSVTSCQAAAATRRQTPADLNSSIRGAGCRGHPDEPRPPWGGVVGGRGRGGTGRAADQKPEVTRGAAGLKSHGCVEHWLSQSEQ